MAIISKRKLRFIKRVLVSTLLEKTLLFSFIFVFIGKILIRELQTFNADLSLRELDIARRMNIKFQQVTTLDAFQTWLTETIPSNFMSSPIATLKIYGDVRIYQIRVQIPSNCFRKNESNYYDYSFTDACNPIADSGHIPAQIAYSSNSDCVTSTCSEYILDSDSSFQIISNYLSYPSLGFAAIIDSHNISSYKQMINTLFNNGWISKYETKAVVFQMNLVEPNSDTFFTYTFQLEVFSAQIIYPTFYRLDLVPINESPLVKMADILLIANGVLFLMKSLYEMSILESNKFIMLLEIASSLLQIASSILSYIVTTSEAAVSDYKNAAVVGTADFFYNYNKYNGLVKAEKFFLMIVCAILPLKLLSLLTWFKNFTHLQKFISGVFRTIPTFVSLFITCIVIILAWSLTFFLSLGTLTPRFEYYLTSILNFLFYNFSNEIMSDERRDLINSSGKLVNMWLFLLLWLMRITLIVIVLGLVNEAYHKAAAFESPQTTFQETSSMEFIQGISKKIEKFIKENIPQLDSSTENQNQKKMIIWLDLSDSDQDSDQLHQVYSMIDENNIQRVPFSTYGELTDFLKYLFQLKPGLLYKSSNLFRIVIRVDNKSNSDRENDMAYDFKNAEAVLNWLKYFGGRIPVLLYFDSTKFYEHANKLKLAYQLLYPSNSIDSLQRFCLMEGLDTILLNLKIEDSTPNMTQSFLDESTSQYFE